jgi:ribosome-associated toxin RatA of RatAB toxin-antitoxin module
MSGWGIPAGGITRLALFLLALVTQGAAAATIAIDVTSQADKIEIEASALLNASIETAWRVLTDYERYVDFIPGLRECRIVARKGATVTVEQAGEVSLWLLHMPLDVTFEIDEIAPSRLDSRVVAGDLRALTSHYVLTPVGNQVRLEYTGNLDSGLALFGPIERLAVKQNVGRRFQALADEIERRPGSGPANPALGSLGRE